MAFTFVQSNSNSGSGASTTLTVALTGVTAGSLIALFAKHESAATTITASDGTTSLTGATLRSHSGVNVSGRWLYLLAANGGNITYTITYGASVVFRAGIVFEYSYTGTASFDAENTAQGTASNAPNSGNFTTTGTDEVSFGGYGETAGGAVTNAQINGVAADGTVQIGGNSTAAWRKTNVATFTGAASCSSPISSWVCCGISFKAVSASTWAGWYGSSKGWF